VTLLEPNENELFHISTHKSLVSFPNVKWVNTYTVMAEADTTFSDIQACATDIATFEQTLMNDTSKVERTKVWLDGTVNEFNSVARELTGSVDTSSTEPMPLEIVLLIAKNPTLGRPGVAGYRDCLNEAEMTRRAGMPSPNDSAALATRVDDAVTANLADYLQAGTGSLTLMKFSATSGSYISIATLSVSGISSRDTDNRWFNRTQSTP